jgi:hypothetical protein
MRKTLVAAILPAGLLAGTAVPVIAATSQSQTKNRRNYRSNSRRRRARNVGMGAAGGAAAGAILGRGSGAAGGAVIGGTAGAFTPTNRRRKRQLSRHGERLVHEIFHRSWEHHVLN